MTRSDGARAYCERIGFGLRFGVGGLRGGARQLLQLLLLFGESPVELGRVLGVIADLPPCTDADREPLVNTTGCGEGIEKVSSPAGFALT